LRDGTIGAVLLVFERGGDLGALTNTGERKLNGVLRSPFDLLSLSILCPFSDSNYFFNDLFSL
jgi:hypothetical protein